MELLLKGLIERQSLSPQATLSHFRRQSIIGNPSVFLTYQENGCLASQILPMCVEIAYQRQTRFAAGIPRQILLDAF
jgi:hypothetical protein